MVELFFKFIKFTFLYKEENKISIDSKQDVPSYLLKIRSTSVFFPHVNNSSGFQHHHLGNQ